MIGCGAGLFAHLFSISQSEWESKPTITTIESVTRPVGELSFPTVTVCRSNDIPADSFAAATKYLSPFAFQCGVKSKKMDPEDCNDADSMKEAFGFVFDFSFDLMEEQVRMLFDGGDREKMLPVKLAGTIDTHARMLDYLIERNVTSQEELADIVRGAFMNENAADFFGSLKKANGLPSRPEKQPPPGWPEAASASSKRLSALALFALSDMGSLGGFMAEVAPLVARKYFVHADTRVLSIKPELCNAVPDEVSAIHSMFANITEAMRTNVKTGRRSSLSSLDLPNLVSLQPFSVVYKERMVVWPIHSICHHLDHESLRTLSDKKYDTCGKRLEEYLYHSGPDPCGSNGTTFCCDASEVVTREELELVMTVVRNANYKTGTMEDLNQYYDLAKLAGYPSFSVGKGLSYKDRNTLPEGKDYFSAIPACVYVDNKNIGTRNGRSYFPVCNLFQPVITDQGICNAFNSYTLEDFVKPSNFRSSMKSAYEREIFNETSLHRAVEYSEEMGLKIYLDRQMLFRNHWRDSDYLLVKDAYKISFSDQLSAMVTRGRQREVRVGYHTKFLLTPRGGQVR